MWKPIAGYDRHFWVNEDGVIASPYGFLHGSIKSTGYVEVTLRYRGKVTYARVHRLVAEAFCDKQEGCDVVNHLDEDKSNNQERNLEWTTISGNTQHSAYKWAKPYSLRDPEGNIHVGVSLTQLCKQYGLNRACMWRLVTGKFAQFKGWTRYESINHQAETTSL